MSEEFQVQICADDYLMSIGPKGFTIPPVVLARIKNVLRKSGSIQAVLYTSEPNAVLYITKESYERNGPVEAASTAFPDLDPVRAYLSFIKKNRKSGVIELHRNAAALLEIESDAPPPRVTFYSPFGAWQLNTQLDSIVGNALKMRGAECRVITCDGMFFDDCYLLRHSDNPQTSCSQCLKCSKQMFHEERPLENLPLSHYVREEDWLDARSWVEGLADNDLKNATFESVPFGKWMIPTMCSYFRYSEEHLSPPLLTDDAANVFRKYLTYAYITYRGMRRAFEDQSTTHLILFNGNGFSQRPALELARNMGIKVLSYHPGLIDKSYMLVEDDVSCALQPQIEFVEKWMEIPLQKSELEKVKDYIYAREYGVGYNRSSFYEVASSGTDVRAALHIPPDRKIISVMTSSKYELSYNPEFRTLPDQLTCLSRLIEMFRKRHEYLVIRHHPQISSSQIGSPDGHFILEILKQKENLPENVRIIMPDEAITSYELLRESDACMTFYSSIGIEALFRGVPTAIFEGTINAFAATELISNSDVPHLSAVLDRLLSRNGKISESELQRAYRFVHTFYFLYSDIFRSFSTTPEGQADIHIKDLSELQPGTDLTLDKVCDFILEGKDFHNLPGQNEKLRSAQEEALFLQAERAALINTTSSGAQSVSSHKTTSDFTICSDDARMSPDIGPVEKIQWEQSLPSLLTQLDSLLGSIKTTFVVFHTRGIEWDGTFLSTSLQMLQEQGLHGVVWDSWLLGHGLEALRISLRPFGPKVFSPVGYEEFKLNPVRFFCLGAFRVSSLKQIIESLIGEKHLVKPETVTEILAHFIQQKKALMNIAEHNILADTCAIDLPTNLIPKESILGGEFFSITDNNKEGVMDFDNIVSLYNSGAYDELQKVLPELCLQDPLYYYPYALVEMKVGAPDRAIQLLNDLLSHVPDHLHGQALKMEIERMQPRSRQPITRQIELECSLDEALYCLKNDDLEKAITILDSIEGSGKIERDYYYVKALYYYSQSKYTDCLLALKRELATYPENQQAQSFMQAIEQAM